MFKTICINREFSIKTCKKRRITQFPITSIVRGGVLNELFGCIIF